MVESVTLSTAVVIERALSLSFAEVNLGTGSRRLTTWSVARSSKVEFLENSIRTSDGVRTVQRLVVVAIKIRILA